MAVGCYGAEFVLGAVDEPEAAVAELRTFGEAEAGGDEFGLSAGRDEGVECWVEADDGGLGLGRGCLSCLGCHRE